jgi:hypothetical protein
MTGRFILTAWDDGVAGGLGPIPGCAKTLRFELPRAVVLVAGLRENVQIIVDRLHRPLNQSHSGAQQSHRSPTFLPISVTMVGRVIRRHTIKLRVAYAG